MSKRILLIDSDESFNADLVSAITAHGFTATAATNSEQGMSLAKEESPDLIVVCVEAQPTNGYMLCTRLKKDEQLKAIPVILTSSNATADSFEKHKKLKTRAEEYLIKPFEPQAILDKASALLGVGPAAEGEEEILAVEDETVAVSELSEGQDEPIALSAADAAEARNGRADEALEIEEVEEVDLREEQTSDDSDLELFDKAFESLGGSAPAPEQTTRFSELKAAPVAPAPREEPPRPRKTEKKQPTELSAPDDDAVLNSLEGGPESKSTEAADETEIDVAGMAVEPPPVPVRRGASAWAGPRPQASGMAEKAGASSKDQVAASEKELAQLREENARLEGELQRLKDEAAQREGAAKALQQRADTLAAAAKKLERELSTAREEAKRASPGEDMQQKVADLESEMTRLREQVAALTGEKEVLAESRDELRRQLEEAQASSEQNEDRAVKAYGRMKTEEKLREKARKALQIALQLLEETGDEDDESPSKKLA